MKFKKEEKKINYGIAILKTILAFYVIRSHYYDFNLSKSRIIYYILGKKRSIHVPSFFIMSFYFNHRFLISKDSKKNYIRLERLLIPYIFWPVIIYLLNNVFHFFLKLDLQCSFKKLIIQIIIGRGIVDTLWFQFDLIITTFLFLFIIYMFKRRYLYILQFLMIFAYLIEYSNYEYQICSKLNNDFNISICREILMIPFGVTGFTFSAFNLSIYLKKYKFTFFIFAFIIFLFVDYFNVINLLGTYKGIKPNILSVCLIIIFSIFPFEHIKNKYITIFIEQITRYTAGIYYLHMPVYSYLEFYILPIKKRNIVGLFFIYIITYSICYFGMLISGKTKAKNLFI